MRLFCLSFAGGSGSFFNGLEVCAGPGIEFVKLEYAGHGERHREAFYRDFDELTEDIYSQIKAASAPGKPYALLGYSMGAVAAAEEVKMILKREELPPPSHVFLASHAPCPVDRGGQTGVPETDEEIMRCTVRFGGLTETLINSRAFWRMYLPIYRADYRLILSYDFSRLDYTTDIPATVLFSPEDIPCAEMEKWHGIFTGPCEVLPYSGGHFFLKEHTEEVAEVIRGRLRPYDI